MLPANRTVSRLVARDTAQDAFNVGDTLNIPVATAVASRLKTPGSPYVLDAATDATVQVVLNRHRYQSFLVEDVTAAQANQDLMDVYLRNRVTTLVEDIERDIFAEMVTATGPIGAYGTAISETTVIQARQALNTANVPTTDRHLVISNKDAAAMLQDANLRGYFQNARPDVIERGALGALFGFEVYESSLVPITAGTPDQVENFAFHRDAVLLAMRTLPDPPSGMGARAASVRDPQSGLVFRVVMGYDLQFGGVRVTVDCLYGVKLVRAPLLVRIRS